MVRSATALQMAIIAGEAFHKQRRWSYYRFSTVHFPILRLSAFLVVRLDV